MTIKEAIDILQDVNKTELPIIDEGRFIGVLRLQDCFDVLNGEPSLDDQVYHLMKKPYNNVRETELMSTIESIPVYVTEEVSERLLGVIDVNEMMAYHKQIQQELAKEREL